MTQRQLLVSASIMLLPALPLSCHAEIKLPTCASTAADVAILANGNNVESASDNIDYVTKLGCNRFVVDVTYPLGTSGTIALGGSARGGNLAGQCNDLAVEIRAYFKDPAGQFKIWDSATMYGSDTGSFIDQFGNVHGGGCRVAGALARSVNLNPNAYGPNSYRIVVKGYNVATGANLRVSAFSTRVQ